ncbi:MAG: hypothetical protein QM768_22890 [Agriterribacter sp.]
MKFPLTILMLTIFQGALYDAINFNKTTHGKYIAGVAFLKNTATITSKIKNSRQRPGGSLNQVSSYKIKLRQTAKYKGAGRMYTACRLFLIAESVRI